MLPDSVRAADDRLRELLDLYRRRFRLSAVFAALTAAAAAGGLSTGILALSGAPAEASRMVSVGVCAVLAALLAMRSWRLWSRARVATALEQRASIHNLLITAEESMRGDRAVHPIVKTELTRRAIEHVEQLRPSAIQPLARAAAMSTAVLVSFIALLLLLGDPRRLENQPVLRPSTTIAAGGVLRVVVTPPAYTGRPGSESLDPASVTVIEGSRVRLEVADAAGPVRLVSLSGVITDFNRSGDVAFHELTAESSAVFVIQQPATVREGRLLQIHVEPDRRPLVRIAAPARDLLFPTPHGRVPIEIDARDDVGLRSLTLRVTRVVGSGEGLSFTGGDIPITIDRRDDGSWRATTTVVLDRLQLGDGDSLVYRAIASDAKPGADPAASESFLIEIGRLSGIAATGFAVPDDRTRQALSQQVLIVKTEQLQAERKTLPNDQFVDQSRLLAIEQRMVRAEFVFMTGGEVVDEVEEAEHAHELAEGRLANEGHAELLSAIREMSRAEERLNAGDTIRALVFERAALRALQRAFDRRRYFLRTLPERARIDEGRRLVGDRTQARGWTRDATALPIDASVTRARNAMTMLAGLLGSPSSIDALTASRVLAVDPTSADLQRLTGQLVAAADDRTRAIAVRRTQQYLMTFVLARTTAGPTGRIDGNPLRGRVADELAAGGRR